MKENYRRHFGIGLLMTAVMFLVFRSLHTPTSVSDPIPAFLEAPPESPGEEEGPLARDRWNWQRLRNPETGQLVRRRDELAFAQQIPTKFDDAAKTQTETWAQRGPHNLGGRTRGLILDVSDMTRQTLLAGGVTGGLYKSTNGGVTWTQKLGASQIKGITDIVQSVNNTSTFYASTGEGFSTAAWLNDQTSTVYGDGIYKSTDGGETWTLLTATTNNTPATEDDFDQIWRLAIDPTATSGNDELYAASGRGFFRSTDSGATWATAKSAQGFADPFGGGGGNASFSADILVTSTGQVFGAFDNLGEKGGIYCSDDGAPEEDDGGGGGFGDGGFSPAGKNNTMATWPTITPNFFPTPTDRSGRIALGVNAAGTELWAIAEAQGVTGAQANHMLARYSIPAGGTGCQNGTWTNFTSAIPDGTNNFTQFPYLSLLVGFAMFVEVHPDNDNIVFLGGQTTFRLDFSDENNPQLYWIGGGLTNSHVDQHVVAFNPDNGDEAWVGHDGGISHTTDLTPAGTPAHQDVTWTSLSNGYYTTQFYDVCFNKTDATDPTIAGGMQDNNTWSTQSVDPTASWSFELGGDGSWCEIVDNTQAPTGMIAKGAQANGNGTTRYVSLQGGYIVRRVYSEAGAFLSELRIDPTGASDYLSFNPFVVDVDTGNNRHYMFLPAGDDLWRNNNLENTGQNGTSTTSDNWTQLTGSTTSDGKKITAVDIQQNTLYFGTENARVFRLDNARTAAAATTPTEISTGGGFPTDGFVSSVIANPDNPAEVVITFSNYGITSIYHTSNATSGTVTWTNVEGNLAGPQGPSVRRAAIMPNVASKTGSSNIKYFLATSTGVYSTTTLNGTNTTWVQEGANTIGNVVVDDIQARSSDGFVLVGTHGAGVFSTSVTLPVELVTFSGYVDASAIHLTWQTASETNNSGFNIEQQHIGAERTLPHWESLGFVEGAGTTQQTQTYQYRISDVVAGRYRFRLRQVDFDGAVEYSNVVELEVELPSAFAIGTPYPNPFRTEAHMDVRVAVSQEVTVAVFNTAGQRVSVLHQGHMQAHQVYALTLSGNDLPGGIYWIHVQGETFRETREVVHVK